MGLRGGGGGGGVPVSGGLMDRTYFWNGLERTFESFGGAVGGSIAVQAAAVTAMSAWWTANGGGTVLFGVGSYTNMPAITFPVSGCTIRGAGQYATKLTVKNSLNADFITNHQSTDAGVTDPNAFFCSVRDLWLEGNKGNNTSGAAIVWDSNPGPSGSNPPADPDFDAHQLVEHVYIKNFKNNGITTGGRSGNYLHNVYMNWNDGVGISVGFDTMISACNIGGSGLQGILTTSPNIIATNTFSYYSGNVTAASGTGWDINSNHNNGVHLSSCGAQDNKAYGFTCNTTNQVQLSSCVADSNSTSSGGTYAAIDFWNSQYCNIDLVCQDRKWNGTNSTQLVAVQMRQGSAGNKLRLTHYEASGAPNPALSNPILSWTSDSLANEVNINKYGAVGNGQQFPTMPGAAGTLTPNPMNGGTIIGTMPAGGITVAAPAAGNYFPGCRMKFSFTQDATGGRVVTWNAIYLLDGGASWSTTTANKQYTIEFEYNATSAKFEEQNRTGPK